MTSLFFVLLVMKINAAVISYPLPVGDIESSLFNVTVNGQTVDVVSCVEINYAQFATDELVDIVITSIEEIESVNISPHPLGYNDNPDFTGNVLQIKGVTALQKLIIKINDLEPLFIFSEPLEVNPPDLNDENVVNVMDYVSDNSGSTIVTEQIQTAIDSTASSGNILYFPEGRYKTGTLYMKSDLQIYLAAGAIIKGTGELSDYAAESCFESHPDFIYFKDCYNVTIYGRGVIDGNGAELRSVDLNASNRKMKIFRSNNAQVIRIYDIIWRDSGSFGWHIYGAEDVIFNNSKIISLSREKSNTDQIDPDGSINVTITNCFTHGFDDGVAIKISDLCGSFYEVRDITIENTVIHSEKSALKIGTKDNGNRISNIWFKNNYVVKADRGISCVGRYTSIIEDIHWVSNHFEEIGLDQKPFHIWIDLQRDLKSSGYTPGKTKMRNIEIKDNIFENVSPDWSIIQSWDSTNPITNLKLINHKVAGKVQTSLHEAKITINNTKNIIISDVDVPFPELDPDPEPNTIWIEAESGSEEAPMIEESDSLASESKCITSSVAYEGTTMLSFNIDTSSVYNLWVRHLSPDGSSNSFFYDFNSDSAKTYKKTKKDENWIWELVVSDTLSEGLNTLKIRAREIGTKLDKFVISNDDALIPTGMGDIPTSISRENKLTLLSDKCTLDQNYPNPFNPSTTINYTLNENSRVQLDVFNISGRKVQTLINSNQKAGHQSIIWNGMSDLGHKVSSGIYLYRLTVISKNKKYVEIKRMLLVK